MILRLLSLYLLLLPFSSVSQQSYDPLSGISPQEPYEIVLPVEKINHKYIIVVKIKNKPQRFILDTGAPLCISSAIQEEIGYPKQTSIQVGDANELKNKMDVYRVDSIQIGNTFFLNYPALLIPSENPIFKCFEVDGLIGSNIFRNSCLEFDDQNEMVTIRNKCHFTKEGNNTLYLDRQGGPYFKLPIAKEKILFDSGSGAYLGLTKKEIRRSRKQLQPVGDIKGYKSFSLHGLSKSKVRGLYYAPSLDFGGEKIFSLEVSELHENRMGAKMLQQGILKIDYHQKRWSFHAYERMDTTFYYWDVKPLQIENQLIIAQKMTNREYRDIQIGDKILKINGVEPTYQDCDSFLGKTAFDMSVDIIELEVMTRKGKRTIEVHKKKMN
jgi:hypothetical protein